MHCYVCVCYTIHYLVVIRPRFFFFISLLYMNYYTTSLSLNFSSYEYVCECYIYGYCDMFLYFIWDDPWLYYVLGILLFIFNIYDLLCQCCHPNWPAFTKWINTYFLDLPFSCHVHWNTYIVPSSSIYHVFAFPLKFSSITSS